MDEVKLSEVIAPQFFPVHRDICGGGHREYVLKGGRGSGKSSFVSIEIALGLLQDPFANAIVFRKYQSELRASVFEQMRWAFDVLGAGDMITRKSPLEIEISATGQRILFFGADDTSKTKALKLSYGWFKYLWMEELTEFSGMDDVRTLQASILRGSSGGVTLMSYNPPREASHWVNREMVAARAGRLCHHSDYRGVPKTWLGVDFLEMAENMRTSDERAYRHMFLGEATGDGGQVFENLVIRPIIDMEISQMDRWNCGVDFGFARDPDAVVRCYLDKREQRLFIVDEFYGVRTPIDQLAEEVRRVAQGHLAVCDSADARMISELRARGVQAVGARKGPGSVAHGMRWLMGLKAIIIDGQKCPNAAREFSGYAFAGDGQGGYISGFVDQENHCIDAVRYACEGGMGIGLAKTIKKAALGM